MRMQDAKAYLKLAKAIEESKSIPPCMTTDPEIWFPDLSKGNVANYRTAVKLCQQCPVKNDCLEYALTVGERFGVWGGVTADQRLQLSRGRSRRRGRPSQNRRLD